MAVERIQLQLQIVILESVTIHNQMENMLLVLGQLAEDTILHLYFTQIDFVTSNDYPKKTPGYKLYVSKVRLHLVFSSAQTIKMRVNFRPPVEAVSNLIGLFLLVTYKIMSSSSDEQRQFEIFKTSSFANIVNCVFVNNTSVYVFGRKCVFQIGIVSLVFFVFVYNL